jgi:hypothetical protein
MSESSRSLVRSSKAASTTTPEINCKFCSCRTYSHEASELTWGKSLRALHRVAADDPAGARDLKPAKTEFSLKFKGTADGEYVPKRGCEVQAPQDSATLPEDTVAIEEEDDVSDGWCSEDVESQDSEGSSDEGDEIKEVVRKSARVKTK